MIVDRMTPGHPLLYGLPARPLVARLSDRLGRPASLADVPAEQIDRLGALGFDHVWLMGATQPPPAEDRPLIDQAAPLWERRLAHQEAWLGVVWRREVSQQRARPWRARSRR